MSDRSDMAKQAADTFCDMMGRLGFNLTIEKTTQDRIITLFVNTDEPGRLIGRRGKYLESAEHLLNSMLKRDGAHVPRVSVDVDGYERGGDSATTGSDEAASPRDSGPRTDADDRVVQLAQDAAKEVKRWGEPKTLGPFAARDRRAVHLALKDVAGVRTESGDEDERHRKIITVLPADTPASEDGNQ